MKKLLYILFFGLFFNTVYSQMTIREGKNAVYLFLTAQTPGTSNADSEFSEVKVFRVDGRKPIEIGQLNKAQSPEELKKISNSEVLKIYHGITGTIF
uniref:hypothetical protein n=1 Tax=Mariniflexile sp. TaxID=1979402 RepID=UPI0040487C65